nr:MAG TPA: hypothetical protein [Caudoviricetes sp.]
MAKAVLIVASKVINNNRINAVCFLMLLNIVIHLLE